jgi:hypothetical protein
MVSIEMRRARNRRAQAAFRARKRMGPQAREVRYDKQHGDGEEPDVLRETTESQI